MKTYCKHCGAKLFPDDADYEEYDPVYIENEETPEEEIEQKLDFELEDTYRL